MCNKWLRVLSIICKHKWLSSYSIWLGIMEMIMGIRFNVITIAVIKCIRHHLERMTVYYQSQKSLLVQWISHYNLFSLIILIHPFFYLALPYKLNSVSAPPNAIGMYKNKEEYWLYFRFNMLTVRCDDAVYLVYLRQCSTGKTIQNGYIFFLFSIWFSGTSCWQNKILVERQWHSMSKRFNCFVLNRILKFYSDLFHRIIFGMASYNPFSAIQYNYV